MTSPLSQIERRTYLLYFQDGIWDLLLGFVFLFIGLSIWIDFNIIGLLPILMVFFPAPLKRRITLPRIGHIRVARPRSTGMAFLTYGVLFFILAGVMLLGILNPTDSPLVGFFTRNLLLLVGILLGGVMAFSAYYMHFLHLYFYALLTFVSFALMRWWGFLAGPVLTLTGVIILIIGAITLRSFIRTHPVVDLPDQPYAPS